MTSHLMHMLERASFATRQRGLTTVEYAVAGGLIAAVVILAFIALGGTVDGKIKAIDGALQ